MTASIMVLKLGHLGVLGIADYYVDRTSSDYYLKGVEPKGIWYGKCAESLGLTGVVEADHFRNLLAGMSPDGVRELVKRPKKSKESIAKGDKQTKTQKPKAEHVPGVDITFSVPKTVSTVWATLKRPHRKQLEGIVVRAIKEGIDLTVQELPLARKGKNGRQMEHAEIAAAIFRHSSSRKNNDPQLHYHVVIPNVVQQQDGTYSKINTRLLHRWVRTLGPLIRNNVATMLQKEMGFELHQPKLESGEQAGWFEIKGVPEKLCKHWSSRSQEINEVSLLLDGMRSSAKAKQQANLMTRVAKQELPSQAELFAQWKSDALKFGFDGSKAEALMNKPVKDIDLGVEFQKAVKNGLRQLTDEHAYFERHKLIQVVSEKLQAVPFTANQIVAKVDNEIRRNEHVLSIKSESGRTVYTTPEMWKVEESVLQGVERLKNQQGAVVNDRTIENVIASQSSLSDEQAQAVRHLLQETGSIRTLVGIAGSGKSFALDTVRIAYEKSGFNVIGGALSGVAKEELNAQANIKSRTVASYRYHLDKSVQEKIIDRLKHDLKMLGRSAQGKSTYRPDVPVLDKKTVLVVDEAGMIGNRTMDKLLRYVEKAGGTIVLVGDSKQLSPIEAGGPFQRIVREVSPATLNENRRLKDPLDVRATNLIREGKAKEALKGYLERGRLIVTANRSEAAKRLVDDWAKDGGLANPKGKIILTQTRAEAKEINRYCQFDRLMSGKLGSRSMKVGATKVYEKDRIMFHKALRIRGIENGFQGTVIKIDSARKEAVIQLDRVPQLAFGQRKGEQTVTLTFDQLKKAETQLAYASTTHKMQGQTVDQCYVLVGGLMTSKELTYVQTTRAREQTKLYVDRAHAGNELEVLEQEVASSRIKQMAHEMGNVTRSIGS